MQRANFTTGGFVIHKIPAGNGKASAWFDAAGKLVAVEAFDIRGRVKRVSAKLCDRCVRIGARESKLI